MIWPFKIWRARTYTSAEADEVVGTAGLCELCNEGAMVYLNGDQLLCWRHYCEAVRPQHPVDV